MHVCACVCVPVCVYVRICTYAHAHLSQLELLSRLLVAQADHDAQRAGRAQRQRLTKPEPLEQCAARTTRVDQHVDRALTKPQLEPRELIDAIDDAIEANADTEQQAELEERMLELCGAAAAQVDSCKDRRVQKLHAQLDQIPLYPLPQMQHLCMHVCMYVHVPVHVQHLKSTKPISRLEDDHLGAEQRKLNGRTQPNRSTADNDCLHAGVWHVLCVLKPLAQRRQKLA